MKLNLDANAIRQIKGCINLHCPYLGFFIEPQKDGAVYVATDGQRLMAYLGPSVDRLEKAMFIRFRKFPFPAKSHNIILDIPACLLRIYSYAMDELEIITVEIENNFPNWKSIVPQGTSGEIAQFDVNLLFGFQLNDEHILIKHNGENSALVYKADPNFLGLIMPFRPDFTSHGILPCFKPTVKKEKQNVRP